MSINSKSNKFKFEFGSYGSEVFLGSINEDQFHYWYEKGQSEFTDYMIRLSDDIKKSNKGIPSSAQFKSDYSITSDILNISGPEFSDEHYLKVIKYNNQNIIVNEKKILMKDFKKIGIKSICKNIYNEEKEPCANHLYYFGQLLNKGTWFSEKALEISEKEINLKKLTLEYDQVESVKIITSLKYNNKKIELYEDSRTKVETFYVVEGQLY